MKLINKFKKQIIFTLLAVLLSTVVILFPVPESNKIVNFEFDIKSDEVDTYQIFYKDDTEFEEASSLKYDYETSLEKLSIEVPLLDNTRFIRVDIGTKPGAIVLTDLALKYRGSTINIALDEAIKNASVSGIENIQNVQDELIITASNNDPYIVFDLDQINRDKFLFVDKYFPLITKIIICIFICLVLFLLSKTYNGLKTLAIELFNNRKLIWDLARNDFKTKYAGSYLGIIWAFVQPVITVLIYWFVFQVGFRSGSVGKVPFVLWLVTGLVPWFFYSDALMNATNSMLEYSYLVKKVVFKISILPIVKILSALFVHVFFIGFTLVLFLIYGYKPSVYILQVFYYTGCTFLLVLGLSYATSAIIIFFRDLSQIILITLQIGMWMTPIMWRYTMVPEKFQWILKINPMYYIVEGYRDTFINQVWFWERYNQTIYFWAITALFFVFGTVIFKRLKVHFADVL